MRMESFVNITGLKKDGPPQEWYLIIWHDSQVSPALQQCARWAANKQLSFTALDAASMACRIITDEDHCDAIAE